MSHTLIVSVSFAAAPPEEISDLHGAILSLGWEPTGDRGDPWTLAYRKVAEDEGDASEAELVAVMGTYWLDASAIKALRR